MNKEFKIKKSILINKRNKTINNRYLSTIKTLIKLFTLKSLNFTTVKKDELNKIKNNLFSILDKAVKKGVIHINKCIRKKIQINNLYSKINY
jgi:small subunit ribosomal protein S20